jgi:Sulfotransferase domain
MSGPRGARGAVKSRARVAWERLPQPVRDAAKTVWGGYAHLTRRGRVLPDFLIIGTQRGGTTSLYKYLVRHPSLAHALTKELRFFDLHYDRGIDWYRSRFPSRRHREQARRRGTNLVVGEASPDYMFHPHVPSRVAGLLPDVKLIVLLRNPVDRAYSHYWHQAKRGHEALSFEEAIDREEERLAGELDRVLADEHYVSYERHHHSYMTRGLYADQLAGWFKHFTLDQFLIERSEDFFADPARTFARVLDFLCLPSFEVADFEVFNAFAEGEMDASVRARLVEHFRPHNARLHGLLDRDFEWDR